MSFDESLKDMTQSCEIDLLHRYFYEIDYKVKGRYYDSQFFGLSTSKDIQKKFNNTVSDLDPNKLFQIGTDSSNVNLKFLQLIQQDREENQQHGLIDIGWCGPFYTIHNTFKTGAGQTDWKMKKILKAAYQIFNDSPGKRDDYFTITGSNQFPSSFCVTRFFPWSIYLFTLPKFCVLENEMAFCYLCTAPCNLGSLKFWLFQPEI